MGFSRQEYWGGLLFPSPGDLSNPGIEPRSPALQADSLPSEPRGKPIIYLGSWLKLGVSDSKTFLFLCAFYCLLENLGHYAVLKDELVAILSALDRRAGVQKWSRMTCLVENSTSHQMTGLWGWLSLKSVARGNIGWVASLPWVLFSSSVKSGSWFSLEGIVYVAG